MEHYGLDAAYGWVIYRNSFHFLRKVRIASGSTRIQKSTTKPLLQEYTAGISQCAPAHSNCLPMVISFPAITEEQESTLAEIADKMNLTAMEEPWESIKSLQSSFNYSKIKYTEEYYDIDLNPAAKPVAPQWKVYFGGTFWGFLRKVFAGIVFFAQVPLFEEGTDCFRLNAHTKIMEQDPVGVPGPHFKLKAPGDAFRFIHPVSQTESCCTGSKCSAEHAVWSFSPCAVSSAKAKAIK